MERRAPTKESGRAPGVIVRFGSATRPPSRNQSRADPLPEARRAAHAAEVVAAGGVEIPRHDIKALAGAGAPTRGGPHPASIHSGRVSPHLLAPAGHTRATRASRRRTWRGPRAALEAGKASAPRGSLSRFVVRWPENDTFGAALPRDFGGHVGSHVGRLDVVPTYHAKRPEGFGWSQPRRTGPKILDHAPEFAEARTTST